MKKYFCLILLLLILPVLAWGQFTTAGKTEVAIDTTSQSKFGYLRTAKTDSGLYHYLGYRWSRVVEELDGVLNLTDFSVSGNISATTYGSDGSVSNAELLRINSVSSNVQDQLDARCLEAVFGTAIGTGLLLDTGTLKASSVLQTYHGINPSANVQTMLGSADNAAIRSNIGLAIGTNVQAYDLDLSGLAGLSGTGLVARTAANTYIERTLTGTVGQITVTNGDGVSGNPIVSLPDPLTIGNVSIDSSITLIEAAGIPATPVSGEGVIYLRSDTLRFLDSNGNEYDIAADPKWYGVTWNSGTDTYERLGSIASYAASATVPDYLLPIQANMKRCLLKNDGTVNYYLRSDNSNFKADGSASVLTGADGQVMVEIPRFYYKYEKVGSSYLWKISEDSLAGYASHPAFLKDGQYVNYRYVGAYEASLYDVSNLAYLNGLYLPTTATYRFSFIDGGANEDTVKCVVGTGAALSHPFTLLEVGEKIVISGTTSNNLTVTVVAKSDAYFTVATGTLTTETSSANVYAQTNFAADTLASISGKAPAIQGTRANFRTAASLRGNGWRQQDYQLSSLVQLLYLIEYASFNSQSKIGNGLTDWSSAWPGWNDYNPIEKAGNSNTNGNATANTSGGNGVTGSYMSYRGIENFYGHLWNWEDGFNINDDVAYICNNETQYADDTATNYTLLGTLANADGWQKYLLNNLNGFLPISVGASSSTYITDYYYQNTGWRVALLGGHSNYGVNAGAFSRGLYDGSGRVSRYFGARLCF